MTKHKRIIVAPLNWGLGHATRCVPIIYALLKNKFTPVIATDGDALLFLRKEFPKLQFLELPSYQIQYGKNLKLSLLLQSPKIWSAVKKEKKIICDFVDKHNDVVGLISDNRFGVRSNKVPSVYISHQLNVLAGSITFLTSKIHEKIIKKFDECWVPDTVNSEFSGKLSSTNNSIHKKYIGVLSRFKKEEIQQKIDVLILLSGPEPNRTLLEEKLKTAFLKLDKKILLVQGKVAHEQKKLTNRNIIIYNYLLSDELQNVINQAKVVVCRSGYSSIMDLAVLGKKAFFIPTKNQSEQEYLAQHLTQKKIAPFSIEDDFTIQKLNKIDNYLGLKSIETSLNSGLFSLFERKRKF